MTTTEIMHDKKVLGTEKVDASLRAPADKFGKTHESSDIINMDKAKFEADKAVRTNTNPSDMVIKDNVKSQVDKVAGTAKDAHLKAVVETKNQNATVKDRS